MQAVAQVERQLMFQPRDFKGSRFRCLLATSLPKQGFVQWMNSLIQPFAEMSGSDRYMPKGFLEGEEARLGDTSSFLTEEQRENVTSWWLAVRQNANTPNWDIVGKCTVGGQQGLVLVEAKAHVRELNPNDRCGAGNERNRNKIVQALKEANEGFGSEWSLGAEQRYQLSNRFAWAWKLASLGTPVVLVYLGFLNVYEMGQPFPNHTAWEHCLLEYADGCVPRTAWNSKIMISGTPLIPLIRSTEVNVAAI